MRPEYVAVLDVETTGFSHYDDHIVELAYALMDRSTIEVFETYDGLEDPGIRIPAASSRVHGIYDTDVVGKKIDWPRVEEDLSGAKAIIAHNAPFDRGFVTKRLPQLETPWRCSKSDIKWAEKGYASAALQALAKANNVIRPGAHNALADVMTVVRLLKIGTNFEEVLTCVSAPSKLDPCKEIQLTLF